MAKLFVVPKGQAEQSTEPEEIDSEEFELSGDTATDLQTAMMAFAFLLDWVDSVGGSDGVRMCAGKVGAFRKEQP